MNILLNTSVLKIGTKKLKVSILNPPLKDGNTHLVEATSNLSDKHQSHLQPSELKGLVGAMIYKGFQLLIYFPESSIRNVSMATFENLMRGRRVTISFGIYYKDWTKNQNLIYFADDFCKRIEVNNKNCQECSYSKEDGGVSIQGSFYLDKTDDCYALYQNIDKRLSNTYKDLLNNNWGEKKEKIPLAKDEKESNLKWWVRYVIVPVLTGGVGIAIIGWIIKNT